MINLTKSFFFKKKIDPKSPQTEEKQEENPVEPIIKIEKTGTVTLIGINRPDVRNCINTEAAVELSAVIEAFENDPESPIAVLYGIGGNFSAGYDLKELSADPENVANILMRSEGAMVRTF